MKGIFCSIGADEQDTACFGSFLYAPENGDLLVSIHCLLPLESQIGCSITNTRVQHCSEAFAAAIVKSWHVFTLKQAIIQYVKSYSLSLT